MKLELHNRWIRLVLEVFPRTPAFRRYRVVPPRFDAPTARDLRRRVLRRLIAARTEQM